MQRLLDPAPTAATEENCCFEDCLVALGLKASLPLATRPREDASVSRAGQENRTGITRSFFCVFCREAGGTIAIQYKWRHARANSQARRTALHRTASYQTVPHRVKPYLHDFLLLGAGREGLLDLRVPLLDEQAEPCRRSRLLQLAVGVVSAE